MTLNAFGDMRKVHFIGIGGIGMSALARYFLCEKWLVSGSDVQPTDIVYDLKKAGAHIVIGHKKTNAPKDGLIIYNQAIRLNNPEFKEAKKNGLKILSYPEAIGVLTRKYKTITVAGSHGKSTTTALVALMMIRAGLDPTVIVGTKVKELGNSNFRRGKSEWLVLEADEFGRAFHHYSPFAAIVTNIDREHLDVYKNLSGVKKSFLKFFVNIREGGYLILNRDNVTLKSLEREIYIIRDAVRQNVLWYTQPPIVKKHYVAGDFPALIGVHNLSNASGAYTLGRLLRIDKKVIVETFKKFKGTWRRLEYRGKFKVSRLKFNVSVYDDYAHHPTEIKATLAAVKGKYPQHNIIAVFQPHQADRLRRLFKEFARAFEDAGGVIILPTYSVAGRDWQSNSKYTSKTLALTIKKKFPIKKVFYLKNPNYLKNILAPVVIGGSLAPILVMMGAGDIVKYTDKLLKK